MEAERFADLTVEQAVAGAASFADLSDFDLLRAAARVVAVPKRGDGSSFEIHAPLELLARYHLLPFVSADDRALVRLQMIASTALYAGTGNAVAPPAAVPASDGEPKALIAELEHAIGAGQVDRSDAAFIALTACGDPMIVLASLADRALRTLTGAAHTHIALMLLARTWGDGVPEILQLARAGVRALAEAPGLNLQPTTGPGQLGMLSTALATVPTVLFPTFSVQAMVQAPEQAGLMDAVIGDRLLAGTAPIGWEDALRTSCRIAALSMLGDSPDGAKYGWTHALTMPQAAWALAQLFPDAAFRRQAAQSSLAWVIAFRATLGNANLNRTPTFPRTGADIVTALYDAPAAAAAVAWHTPAAERGRLVRVLASEAAVRVDAHLVKYVRACCDVARLDATYAHLYYAAAAYLCALWCCEEPRDAIRERLSAPRN